MVLDGRADLAGRLIADYRLTMRSLVPQKKASQGGEGLEKAFRDQGASEDFIRDFLKGS